MNAFAVQVVGHLCQGLLKILDKLEMVELFKAGKISQARKLVCSQARPDEIEDIYKWLYDNVALFGDDAKQEKAILVIKQGLVDHTLVADPEINLAATMIRLQNI